MRHHMWTAFILLLLPAAVATATTDGCPPSCGGVHIPYPFGIGAGCFRKGFEIECAKGGPVLAVAGTPLRVVKLSLDPDESQVMLPIGSQCFNASSPAQTDDIMYGETAMNEHGVYRISDTHNMLVVGCNTVSYIASKETAGGGDDYAYNIGCMSYCNNSASAQDGL